MKKCVFIACIFCVLSLPAFGAVSSKKPWKWLFTSISSSFCGDLQQLVFRGVASMGIYTSPGVLSYVVKGSKARYEREPWVWARMQVEVKEWEIAEAVGNHCSECDDLGANVGSGNLTVCQYYDGSKPGALCGVRGFFLRQRVSRPSAFTPPHSSAPISLDGSKLDTQLNLVPGHTTP